MNWYKLTQIREEDFAAPGDKQDIYYLQNAPDEKQDIYYSQNITSPNIGELGIRADSQSKFFENMPGAKKWLIRWMDYEGNIRAGNILNDNKENALKIFEENMGEEIINTIDIIAVGLGAGRPAIIENHQNSPLDTYELKQLTYLSITPEQIEKSKTTTKRPFAYWRVYIEQHFGLQKRDQYPRIQS